MSDADEDGGPGRREVAYRLFAAEFDDADFEHSESDRERAPNYVVTPTGARVNRLFVVGVLTEVEPVSDEVRRARVVDPTGAFVLYAGQYQPDERAFLERAEPPAFVAVTGKARTFQPGDADRVFTSVRPESISEVDADTRDRWTVNAADRTIERIEAMATALGLEARGDELRGALEERGVEEGLAAGIALALDHYGTTPAYLAAVRDLAVQAARHVAGDVDEVSPLDVEPDEAGDVTPEDLLGAGVEPLGGGEEPATAGEPEPSTATAAEAAPGGGGDAEAVPEPASSEASEADEATPEPGEIETDAFEMDEAERESIEEEYGTEFQAGTEVDEPGEADIETPGAPSEEAASAAEGEPAEAARDADGGETDLVDAAVSAMEDIDEGDGAARSAVVEAVVERTGADQAAVEDAIQDALMDGRCYEPEDATLKAI